LNPRQRAIVVSTGGTIEMSLGVTGFVMTDPPEGPEDPEGLPSWITVEHVRRFALPSPSMTPARMAELCVFVKELEDSGSWDGIVVTHGTDTLEESAFLSDVFLEGRCPVVFTAAMRSSAELGVDGPRNLRGSLLTAVSDGFQNFGTVVVLNDEIHAAARVTKAYTSNVCSFASPGYGPLGFVDEDRVIFTRMPLQRLHLPPGPLILDERVGLVRVAAGLGAREVDFCAGAGDRAIVVEAFGRGNVPPDVADAVGRASEAGLLVAIASRCYMGRVLGVYGYAGGGSDLQRRGAVFAGDLPGHKVRLFLMACLGAGLSRGEIAKLLEAL
jgi:L-asparaginase